MTRIGNYSLLKLSHKIKISFKNQRTKITNKEQDLVEKVSITLENESQKKFKADKNYASLVDQIIIPETKLKTKALINSHNKVFYDKDLYKEFKKKIFLKLDLHGETIETAKKKVLTYFETNSKQQNLLHIIITGLGNKPHEKNFFSGKIRNSFVDWIIGDPIKYLVHSYHPCKIQHGGLGAFYVKLKSIK